MKSPRRRVLFALLLAMLAAGGCRSSKSPLDRNAQRLPGIVVSPDQRGFVERETGKPFTPWGFNYDRDYKFRLLEDYWEAEWPVIAGDFREMKTLGANVVRVHLQFAKFMDGPDRPNPHALSQLGKLTRLAEETGLYLDITGLACYRKRDVRPWYDALDETDRWAAQARFWEAIAQCCADSRAVFCYNLMNEPIVPAARRQSGDWLLGELAGFYYVQAITLDPTGRSRSEVARQWINRLSDAIRRHDRQHLITVGLLPNSGEVQGGSGFLPREVGPRLDYVSVHLYPKSGRAAESMATLKQFAVGKPVVIEEMFPLECQPDDLGRFIVASREIAAGWLGFYWGQTPAELAVGRSLGERLTLEWLKLFQAANPATPSGRR